MNTVDGKQLVDEQTKNFVRKKFGQIASVFGFQCFFLSWKYSLVLKKHRMFKAEAEGLLPSGRGGKRDSWEQMHGRSSYSRCFEFHRWSVVIDGTQVVHRRYIVPEFGTE